MSLQTAIQRLKALRAKAAALAEKIHTSRTQTLKGIHKTNGFETVDDFIAAVRTANSTERGGKRRGRHRKSSGAAIASAAPASNSQDKRKSRSKITPEMKDQLKAMVKAGKTGKEIANALGISLPSVHNVKKELGLTKAR